MKLLRKVKPKLQWKSEDVGGTRNVEHLPRTAAGMKWSQPEREVSCTRITELGGGGGGVPKTWSPDKEWSCRAGVHIAGFWSCFGLIFPCCAHIPPLN